MRILYQGWGDYECPLLNISQKKVFHVLEKWKTFILLFFLVLTRVSEGKNCSHSCLRGEDDWLGLHSGPGVKLQSDMSMGSGHQGVQSTVETLPSSWV